MLDARLPEIKSKIPFLCLCLGLFSACSDSQTNITDVASSSDLTTSDNGQTPQDDVAEKDTGSTNDVVRKPELPDHSDTAQDAGTDTVTPEPKDQDGDEVDDSQDNCPTIPNRSQADLNKNGVGDVCDPDEPATGIAFYGKFTLPCEETGCPDDRNIDLYRAEFDLSKGTVKHVRLTNNSDGKLHKGVDYGPDDDVPVALSPDQKWLYYQNALSGHLGVRRIAADGLAKSTLITPEGASCKFVHLTADGNTLYYLSNVYGDNDLYSVNASDGTGLKNLPNNTENDEAVLAVLPDDSGVVFMLGLEKNDPDNTGADGELHVLHFADSKWNQLTDDRVWNRYQSISADGGWVAYRRPIDENNDGKQEKGSGELWVVQTSGDKDPIRLGSFAEGKLGDIYNITHDNKSVLYQYAEPKSSIKQIYSVAIGGDHAITQLTKPASGESSYYRMLTGDAKTLVYTSNDVAGGFGDVEVYTTPLAGGAATLVSTTENNKIVLPRGVLDAQKKIVIEGNFDGGDYDLYVGALDGSSFKGLVVNDFFSDTYLTASPGGRWVFFRNCSVDYTESAQGCSYYENDQDIYAVSTDGTVGIVPITSNDTKDLLWRVYLTTP